MVDLSQIALEKGELTPTTFALLLVQQGSQFALGKRMRLLQSLGPIEQVSVKWAGVAFDLHMALDRGGGVIAEIETIRGRKPPMVLPHSAPVAPPYPTRGLVRVSAFGPSKKQWKQVVVAIIEDFLGGDTAIVA